MNQTLKEKHDKIKDKNKVLIRENMKLYRQLRFLRLKLKQFQSPEEEQTGLETLANLATTMMDTPEHPIHPVEVRRPARTRASSSKKPWASKKGSKVSIFTNFEIFSKMQFRWFRRTRRLFITHWKMHFRWLIHPEYFQVTTESLSCSEKSSFCIDQVFSSWKGLQSFQMNI